MDKQREEIAKKLYDDFYLMVANDKQREMVADNIADGLLAIFNNAPSGLVAKKGCLNFICRGNMSDKECVDCNGTGFITRPLTVKEALEFARNAAANMTFTNEQGESVEVAE